MGKNQSTLRIESGKFYENGHLFTGKGICTCPDGSKYEGDFVDGKESGKGVYTWPDGGKYEGDFVDGQRTGKGVHTWPDGGKYEGDYVDGQKTGKGVHTWSNGARYEGDFVNGHATGKGVFTWPDGRKYEGDHVKMNACGIGKMYKDGKLIKMGEWENDELVKGFQYIYDDRGIPHVYDHNGDAVSQEHRIVALEDKISILTEMVERLQDELTLK